MRTILDDIEVRIFRSRVKIPMIFLVPALVLLSLYLILYIAANSGAALALLNAQLNAQFPGRAHIARVVISPTFSQVRVYGISLDGVEGERLIRARELHATLNPWLLWQRRLSVTRARLIGADVRMRIDDEGRLNLLRALGIEDEEPPEAQPSKLPITLSFANISIEDSSYAFAHPDFDFSVPVVEVAQGELLLDDDTLLMHIPGATWPSAHFRFGHQLFGMPEEEGDWRFSLRDFKVDTWRWVNDGYTARCFSADIGGFQVELTGRMGFPGGDETMTYDARGWLSVPFHAPLLQYFARENFHMAIPGDPTRRVCGATAIPSVPLAQQPWRHPIAMEGTLQHIEGAALIKASIMRAIGLTLTDVEARVSLRNALLTIHDASASFHQGRVTIEQGFFHLLEKRYAMVAAVDGVNPASVMQEMGSEQPYLSGAMRARLLATGSIPRDLRYEAGRPYATLDHATDKWVDLTLLEDGVYERDNQEVFPLRQIRVREGARAWVDLDRFVVPSARLASGPDQILLEDFALDYVTMRLDPQGLPAAKFTASIADLAPYFSYYGLQDVRTGPARGTMRMMGSVTSPEMEIRGHADEVTIAERFRGRALDADMRVERGDVLIRELRLSSDRGDARVSGRVKAMFMEPVPERPGDFVYVPRLSMPLTLKAEITELSLTALTPFLPTEAKPSGSLTAQLHIGGTHTRPRGCVAAEASQVSVYGQKIPAIALRAAQRDGDTSCGDVSVESLHPGARGARVEVAKLAVDLGGAGRLDARGTLWGDGKIEGSAQARALDLSKLAAASTQDIPLQGRGDAAVNITGTQRAPTVDGHLRLRGFGVGPVKTETMSAPHIPLGDVALVINTLEEQGARRTHAIGQLLPWLTIDAAMPWEAGAPLTMALSAQRLDLVELVRALRLDRVKLRDAQGVERAALDLTQLERLGGARLTGQLQLSTSPDLSELEASIDLDRFSIGPSGARLRNEQPLLARYVRGPRAKAACARVGGSGDASDCLTLEQINLRMGDQEVGLVGVIDPTRQRMDLKTTGALELGPLSALAQTFSTVWPEEIVGMRGQVALELALRGAIAQPELRGQVSVQGVEVQLRSLPEPLLLRRGRVSLSPEVSALGGAKAWRNPLRMRIEDEDAVRGAVLGGEFSITGEVGLEALAPRTAQLRFWAHTMSYSVPELASATLDTDLTLVAPDLDDKSSWMVSGSVDILDGVFYKNISFLEEQLKGRLVGVFSQRAELYQSGVLEQMPELGEISFDLALRAREGFKLKSQIERFDVDLSFRLDLRLTRTLREPRVTGDIVVADGVVVFQNKRFVVRSGLVRFEGDASAPYIDLLAGTEIRNACSAASQVQEAAALTPTLGLSASNIEEEQDLYYISLNIRGYPETLNILYESLPYVDQRDVISLILTGCTVDLLTSASASQPTLETVLGPLIGKLEREIQGVVEVDELTIAPGVERTRVRISDSVTRRLSWKLQLDTIYNSTSGQSAQLEYRLTERLSSTLSESSQSNQQQALTGRFTIDLQLKYRLPLD